MLVRRKARASEKYGADYLRNRDSRLRATSLLPI
jgi:hypothetical protein